MWPCPRQYPGSVVARRGKKWLIPADLPKEQLGALSRNACNKVGHGPNLEKQHVFDEPHKRYNSSTQTRERHKHVIFKMKTPFAHSRVQKELAQQGVYRHFSFNLVG